LYTIATNEAINCQRRAKQFRVIRQPENDADRCSIVDNIVGNEPEPFAEEMDREIASKVREAVDQLPKQLKQAVYMVYFQGMTYREAAEAVGIHFTALSLRLKKAVGKLNFMLKNVG
jgi:RNA polymerase sigma-70 factor (ECF subfamily)